MKEVTVKVPGKVMLAGEYAVLRGGPALAFTLDRWLTVRGRRLDQGGGCRVRSVFLQQELDLQADAGGDREPLADAVKRGLAFYGPGPVALDVDAGLDVRDGTGSSSALRLGIFKALESLADDPGDAAGWEAARHSWRCQQRGQQRASGYDVATQQVGGLVRFAGPAEDGSDPAGWPVEATRLDVNRETMNRLIEVRTGGSGSPTGPLTRSTLDWLRDTGQIMVLQSLSADLVRAFEEVLCAADPAPDKLLRLHKVCGYHRRLFEDSPGFPGKLAADLAALPGLDQSWSWKTTGAGGEDAVLLIGPEPARSSAAGVMARHGRVPLEAEFPGSGVQILEEA